MASIYLLGICRFGWGYGSSSSLVWMGELVCKESWVPKNWCFWTVVLEKTLESPLDCKEIQPVHPKVLGVHWKDGCWSWSSNTLATWCKELTHWRWPWCWERLKAGGERDKRGWDGWMASLMWWTWVWVGSGSWWWTGKPGVLQSVGLQRVGHDWATQLHWWTWLGDSYSGCRAALGGLGSSLRLGLRSASCIFILGPRQKWQQLPMGSPLRCWQNCKKLSPVVQVPQKHFLTSFFFFFQLHFLACRILVPWPGIEPVSSSVKMQSPNHWTAREFPWHVFFQYHQASPHLLPGTDWMFYSLTQFWYIYLEITSDSTG